jgi:hypothetical protein
MLKRVRLQGFGCFAALAFDVSGEPVNIRWDGSGNTSPLRKTRVEVSEYNQHFTGCISACVEGYLIVSTVCKIGAMYLIPMAHEQFAQIFVLNKSQVSE